MKYIVYFFASILFICIGLNFFILFLFISFVPALIIANSKLKIIHKLSYIIPIIFVYTFFATQWIVDMYKWYAVLGLCFVSIIFTIPFALAFFIKIKSDIIRLLVFISSWITIEFLILKFHIIPPLHLLGNMFYNDVSYVQFYEYTGVLGGSLWVLLVNAFIYMLIKSNARIYAIISVCVLTFIPLGISQHYYNSSEINDDNFAEICFFHVNNNQELIHSDLELVKNLLGLIKGKINDDVQFVILPECTLTSNNRLEFLSNNLEFFLLQKFASLCKNLKS